jgi:tRNA(Arg) A34 adenosine deaminase TadA
MKLDDEALMQVVFQVALNARAKGNHPFGALLVDDQGNILMEGENTVVTTNDCTAHAETNLMRMASQKYDRNFLAGCSVYASTEPCCMCSGAIFWGNVRRVVFGLRQEVLCTLVGDPTGEALPISCLEIFAGGNKMIEVIGPVLEDEAARGHAGFWVNP